MKNNFINSLSNALYSENVPKIDIDKIIARYENFFASGIKEGKTEEELVDLLEDPNLLAKNFSSRLNVKHAQPQKIKQTEERKIRSTVSIIFGLMLFSLLALIASPIFLAFFVAGLSILLLPIIFTTLGISLIIYDTIYVNGYQLYLSIISRLGLGIGLIGLSIFIVIGLYYLWKLFFKLVARFYSSIAYLTRRYK